jgi:hypothetical protein
MRKAAIVVTVLTAMGFAIQAQAADKVRLAYTVQVHQANMMVLADYAKKYGIDVEPVPMRRYADQQLALMTSQVDVAVMGYVNVGLMEEKDFRDYRVISGVFTGGQSLTLGKDIKATNWKATRLGQPRTVMSNCCSRPAPGSAAPTFPKYRPSVLPRADHRCSPHSKNIKSMALLHGNPTMRVLL